MSFLDEEFLLVFMVKDEVNEDDRAQLENFIPLIF